MMTSIPVIFTSRTGARSFYETKQVFPAKIALIPRNEFYHNSVIRYLSQKGLIPPFYGPA